MTRRPFNPHEADLPRDLEPTVTDMERYLDDSPELLLDQLPLQRVARDGQLGIFGHGGFGTGMDTFRDWTDLNRRWDAGDPWKVWMD